MQMLRNLVLPDVIGKDEVDFGMRNCQIENLWIKMIFVAVADKYEQVFLWS